MCIDEGTRVTRLTSNEWSTLEVGTKLVVMRVIIPSQQRTIPSSGYSYRCSCGAVNPLGVGSIMYSLERQAGSSIDCRFEVWTAIPDFPCISPRKAKCQYSAV